MAKRILVPVDRGEDAEAVVPLVAALARGAGATVRLLYVSPIPEPRLDKYDRIVADTDQEMDRLRAKGSNYLQRLEAQFEGVPVERVVRFGKPVEEILLEAETFGADLIVMTSLSRGWLKDKLLGNIASLVLRRSESPVMLLRDAAARKGPRDFLERPAGFSASV